MRDTCNMVWMLLAVVAMDPGRNNCCLAHEQSKASPKSNRLKFQRDQCAFSWEIGHWVKDCLKDGHHKERHGVLAAKVRS